MSNKIWNFDILVDDCFVNFNTKKQEINPDHNDRLLSVANGFEDGSWRYRQFKEFVFSNIAETALSAQEREKLIDNDYGRLIEAAKHLRLVDKEQNGKGSEIAEIILYGIMKNHYKALSAIPKIFYKQNDNDNAKGSDSVHIVIDPNGGFQLWLGEAKFYNSLEDARLYEPINSVEQMLRKPIMKKECGIMTNLNELDKQIENQTLLKKIKECFDENTSIDEIKPKLHIPSVLHTAQSQVLKKLLEGKSVAVSAPTSFGKSFVIDAFIAIKQPINVVILVPTVALADETRRRICRKFSHQYKIITTTDVELAEKNILVFPQERAFAYIDKLPSIDILIVDEFYKASTNFDLERSSTLLSSMVELGKKAKQRYYLAPNIHEIEENVFTEGMTFLRMDFKTVVTHAWRLYKSRPKNEDKQSFKTRKLIELINTGIGKALIYTGTYKGIEEVTTILNRNLYNKDSELLANFSDWLECNYGEKYILKDLVKHGIGIHNGQLHRSLSQIQIKLFEEQNGLDYLVSTSSIIEGVNTQAESVVLWSNKNGAHKIDYFTFRNIIGRAGRMFRYFVGRVYMLEEPPSQENTKLRLEFPDDVVKKLDGNDPGIKLNNEQYVKIQRYQDEMIELLGTDIWHRIERIPQIRSCKPSMLKIIAEKLKTDSNWPTNCDALQNNNTWEWRDALGDIIEILEYHRKGHLRYYACACSNGWKMTIKELYNTVKDYGITYEDIFTFERYVSFNLSSIIAVINIIRQELYPNSSNIANFVYKASNAFLPKIVFQLEEYGLPRMISKKIQNAGLINLEDDSKEITIVIQEFNTIGIEYLEQKIPNLHSFDKYILKHFMNGIRCITTNQKN